MALSDCSKCWETPCMCGHGYEDWSVERKEILAKAVLQNMDRKNIKKLITELEKEQLNDFL